MDFFQHQDRARRQTTKLVVLFILATIAVAGLVPGLAWLFINFGMDRRAVAPGQLPQPAMLLTVFAGVLVFIALASLYRMASLTGGGQAVAESLGGRRIPSMSQNPDERKLLNIVEEMAIASGVPVPPVYVLQSEGINAFAAGWSTSDAVIGVTEPCMTQLTRDELQGVIGHEFSHILNGDMRLNLRLIGVVFGILAIGVIGRGLIDAALRMRFSDNYSFDRSGKEKKGGDPRIVLILLGLGLLLIGALGTFFGNLIKAAISRQREFLADASAVQFTRNPQGIASALRKISRYAQGSSMSGTGAREISHMFFADGFTHWLGSLMATHPPLEERIARIDPHLASQVDRGEFRSHADLAAASLEGAQDLAHPLASGFTAAHTAQALQHAVEHIGRPSADHLAHANHVIQRIPQPVSGTMDSALGAAAVVLAMLVHEQKPYRDRQLEAISDALGPAALREVLAVHQQVSALDPDLRLPVLDRALPLLRQMSQSQRDHFQSLVKAMATVDQQVTVFEWMLSRVLLRHLSRSGDQPSQAPRAGAASDVMQDASILLSALAYAGHRVPAQAAYAFGKAVERTRWQGQSLLPASQCSASAMNAALDAMGEKPLVVRKAFLEACARCVSADGSVKTREAELLRGIADGVDCPVPLVLPG